MYNSDQHNHHRGHHHRQAPPLVSPRISFSNDFVESSHHINIHQHRQERSLAPVSSDFEFSVTNYSMMSADELFSKGKLLPYRENNNNNNNNTNQSQSQRTLREELLVNDHQDDHHQEDKNRLKIPKSNSTRWKGFLGLRRSHIGSRKSEPEVIKNNTSTSTTSQEILNEGGRGSSCTDMEIGI
ncbi:hypothetical protein ACFE04_002131 [Oxalis oulophora]